MNEQLIVKNFGPIKDATVDFKKVTVFIGPTGGGKSTLAKLAAVLRDVDFYAQQNGPEYLFDYYSLEDYFNSSSALELSRGRYKVKAKGRRITYDHNTRRLINSQVKQATQVFNKQSTDKIPELAKTIRATAKSTELVSTEIDEIVENIKSITDTLIHETSLEILKLVFSKIFFYKHPVYIPSERIFVSALNNSWAGLMRDDIGLPAPLLTFANNYAQIRSEVNALHLPMFDVKYIHRKDEDFIEIKNNKKLINLHNAASGIQSVAPLLVLIEHLAKSNEQAQSFIIEEPELNLYPTTQQGLLNWLVEKCTTGENDLTITTHSPYILSHLNLLLYAYQVAERHPDRADDVAKIVPRESWINPKEFAAYHVEGQKENGVHSIVNPETGLISYNDLDALAGNSATEFDQLLDINAGLEAE
ncbi:putative ATPase [Hymenobacter luteus]|uniref:ATPase n=2 Tax=Hymenobacter TaxID=89966 RepID=A0ABR6JST2_9BACT|nr:MULTISPECIES: AAA family ATPase [Hymenobacter]MBB4599882.1 putative ATPase [Hymenobacter latericoloratus]MBB6057808.1 putative ATPase [Hymenobacter luteus]